MTSKRVAAAAGLAASLFAASSFATETSVFRIESRPATPGLVFGYMSDMLRSGGGAELKDMTVGAMFSVRHDTGVHQWAIGAVTEAWAYPGSRSILVGFESAVVNEEPSNLLPKIAYNAVMKNRADTGRQPHAPFNANSIAYWVSAQPGTGFERGLVFDRDSLAAVGQRPAVIDLSELPDALIGQVDLIRIRKHVSLRYDPTTRQLVLHVDATAAPTAAQ